MSFNRDGYIKHCDDYKSYVDWLERTNKQRLIAVKGHNQKIDGKNMLHCRRLIEMALEISRGEGVNVKRYNAKYLLSIKNGEVDLQTLIDNAECDLREAEKNFRSSNLRSVVDKEKANEILIKMRKKIYNI